MLDILVSLSAVGFVLMAIRIIQAANEHIPGVNHVRKEDNDV